jgi:hypothetical protein
MRVSAEGKSRGTEAAQQQSPGPTVCGTKPGDPCRHGADNRDGEWRRWGLHRRRSGDGDHKRQRRPDRDELHTVADAIGYALRRMAERNELADTDDETTRRCRLIDINFVISSSRCPLAAATGPETYTIVHNVRSRNVRRPRKT